MAAANNSATGCNINGLFSRLTNNSSAQGGAVSIQGVASMTVQSESAVNNYSSIGSIGIIPGQSQATLITNNTISPPEIELQLTTVTIATSTFQPTPPQNWYISGVGSCP